MNALGIFAANKIDLNPLPNITANGGAIQIIITITIAVIGAMSVLFITIGGFRYIISQGDPQAIGKAKATILYALIGLVIAIVAQTIVAFVLGGI